MVGLLEIAIFLFATSVHNGQALAHWARAIASFTHHFHQWIEFSDWIGFIWHQRYQSLTCSYIYLPFVCSPMCRPNLNRKHVITVTHTHTPSIFYSESLKHFFFKVSKISHKDKPLARLMLDLFDLNNNVSRYLKMLFSMCCQPFFQFYHWPGLQLALPQHSWLGSSLT